MSRVQKASGRAAGVTSLGIAFTSNVTAASLLVACPFGFSDTTFTIGVVDDNLNGPGTDYTESSERVWNATSRSVASIYYFPNSGAGACTVTCNASATVDLGMVVIEYSAMATVGPVDVTDANGANNTGSTPTTADLITLNANDVLVASLTHDGGPAPTLTVEAGWTLVDEEEDATSGTPWSVAEKFLTATATDQHTWTVGDSVDSTMAFTAFKEAAGAADQEPSLVGGKLVFNSVVLRHLVH